MLRPKAAWLTVNRICNFRCQWCYGQSTGFKYEDTMPYQLAVELTNIAINAGVQNINIIGGEPTLWPFLDQYITYCRKVGVKTGLVTNACRFSDDDFWKKYSNNPCDYMGISIKSANKESFIKATGVPFFEKTLLGIKRGLSLPESGVSTVFNNVIGLNELIETAKLCKKLGAEGFTISMCSAVLNDSDVTDLWSIKLAQLSHDIMDFYPTIDSLFNGRVTLELYLPLCLFPHDFIDMLVNKKQILSICQLHERSGIVFDTNGDILPCNTMVKHSIASIKKDFSTGSDLLKYMNCEDMVAQYRELLKYPSLECSKCRYNSICRGGCIVNWMIFDPSICHHVS